MTMTEQVWKQYHAGLQGFIRSRVSDRASADDILQDVFVRIHSQMDTLKESAKLQSWIYRIARNAIIDYYRAHKKTEELPETLTAPEPEEGDEGSGKEIAGCIRPMIESLPEHYREAIMLSELEGLTQREVAERQGLSLPGAKARVQRGRAMMKEMLLDCCHFEFDSRGGVIDYQSKGASCGESGTCEKCGPPPARTSRE